MELRMRRITYLAVGLLAANAALAQGSAPQVTQRGHEMTQDVPSRSLLRAMLLTPTAGHPDLYGEYAGMQYFADGNYKTAMKYFLIGARYADKPSQLSIGLMYLNGQGVRKDPAAAFAWVALAAERGYPKFLATRNAIWTELDAAQRKQAEITLEKLFPEYGDAVAKPRLVVQMRLARNGRETSPFLADQIGPSNSFTAADLKWADSMPPQCGTRTMFGLPPKNCGILANVKWYWSPREYFQVRDAAMNGTLALNKMKRLQGEPGSAVQPKQAQGMADKARPTSTKGFHG